MTYKKLQAVYSVTVV